MYVQYLTLLMNKSYGSSSSKQQIYVFFPLSLTSFKIIYSYLSLKRAAHSNPIHISYILVQQYYQLYHGSRLGYMKVLCKDGSQLNINYSKSFV